MIPASTALSRARASRLRIGSVSACPAALARCLSKRSIPKSTSKVHRVTRNILVSSTVMAYHGFRLDPFDLSQFIWASRMYRSTRTLIQRRGWPGQPRFCHALGRTLMPLAARMVTEPESHERQEPAEGHRAANRRVLDGRFAGRRLDQNLGASTCVGALEPSTHLPCEPKCPKRSRPPSR